MYELSDPAFLEELIKDSGGVLVTVPNQPVDDAYGDISTYGHFNEPEDEVFEDGRVIHGEPTVDVPHGILPALRVNEEIVVDGITYFVSSRRRVEDGAMMRIWIRPKDLDDG